MNSKNTLISALEKRYNLDEPTARYYAESVIDAIKDGIINGDPLKTQSLGAFDVVEKKGRTVINPVTKKKMKYGNYNALVYKSYIEIEPKPKPIYLEDEKPAAVVEEKPVPVVEEKPAEKVVEKVIEKVVQVETVKDNYKWRYDGRIYTTEQIKGVIKSITTISDEQIDKTLTYVIANIIKNEIDICEVIDDGREIRFEI